MMRTMIRTGLREAFSTWAWVAWWGHYPASEAGDGWRVKRGGRGKAVIITLLFEGEKKHSLSVGLRDRAFFLITHLRWLYESCLVNLTSRCSSKEKKKRTKYIRKPKLGQVATLQLHTERPKRFLFQKKGVVKWDTSCFFFLNSN